MFTRVFKFVRVWEFLIICESLREFAKVCKSYWVWNIFRFQKFLRVFELLRVFECLRVFESLRVFKSKSFWKFSRVFEFLRGFDSFWEFSKVFENFHILFNKSTQLMAIASFRQMVGAPICDDTLICIRVHATKLLCWSVDWSVNPPRSWILRRLVI